MLYRTIILTPQDVHIKVSSSTHYMRWWRQDLNLGFESSRLHPWLTTGTALAMAGSAKEEELVNKLQGPVARGSVSFASHFTPKQKKGLIIITEE